MINKTFSVCRNCFYYVVRQQSWRLLAQWKDETKWFSCRMSCVLKLLFLSVESGGNEESDPAAVCR